MGDYDKQLGEATARLGGSDGWDFEEGPNSELRYYLKGSKDVVFIQKVNIEALYDGKISNVTVLVGSTRRKAKKMGAVKISANDFSKLDSLLTTYGVKVKKGFFKSEFVDILEWYDDFFDSDDDD